jgi:hypothetical protein
VETVASLTDRRLAAVRASFAELAGEAAAGQMSYLGFLAELLMAECDERACRRAGSSR